MWRILTLVNERPISSTSSDKRGDELCHLYNDSSMIDRVARHTSLLLTRALTRDCYCATNIVSPAGVYRPDIFDRCTENALSVRPQRNEGADRGCMAPQQNPLTTPPPRPAHSPLQPEHPFAPARLTRGVSPTIPPADPTGPVRWGTAEIGR